MTSSKSKWEFRCVYLITVEESRVDEKDQKNAKKQPAFSQNSEWTRTAERHWCMVVWWLTPRPHTDEVPGPTLSWVLSVHFSWSHL